METNVTNTPKLIIMSVRLKKLINASKHTPEQVVGEMQRQGIKITLSTFNQRFLTNLFTGPVSDACEVISQMLECKISDFAYPEEETGPEAA